MLVASTLALAGRDAAAWPQFRGPNRDGKATPGMPLLKAWPQAGPRLLWRYDQLGSGFASATIADGVVYITGLEGEDGFLYALNLEGGLLWKSPYGRDWNRSHGGTRTTPTIRDGRLYIMSAHGKAACFDARTGKELWAVDTVETFGARNLSWGITESPLVLDGKVIFTPGGPTAGVVALHPETGATLWVTEGINDSSGYCSPIAVNRGGRTIIAQLTGTTFIGIQADNGQLLWREDRRPTPAHRIQAVSPVYEDGRFYVTAGYGGERGEMFNLSEDGTQVTSEWRDSELDCHHGGLVVRDGFVYGAADRNNRNQWLCLNLETGAVAAMIPGVGKGSVIYADGRLYTLAENGVMGLVDPNPEAFRLISSFKLPSGGRGPYWAHPSIADGRLYIRHDNTLFVYAVSFGPGER